MKKAAYWIAFVVCAASIGAYMARDPWLKYQQERASERKSEQDMRRAEAERAELMRQKSRLKSPAGREEMLRRDGYIKPGEEPLGAKP